MYLEFLVESLSKVTFCDLCLRFFIDRKLSTGLVLVNSFPAIVLFLVTLKTSENFWFSDDFSGCRKGLVPWNRLMKFNSYGASPTKWSNTLKQFIGNRVSLSVFDHFLRLALNGLGWFYLAKFNFVMFPKILTLS